MSDEKMITVEDGGGFRKRIPESKLPEAQKAYAYLRDAAKKPGSGYTPEEADKRYSLRIVKDGE